MLDYHSVKPYRWITNIIAALAGVILIPFFVIGAQAGPPTWTNLWKGFQAQFIDNQGRVIDYRAGGITTSEGEAYALFFSLVANDRVLFNRILAWTQNNLAQGNLENHLPSWKWGKSSNGQWEPLSKESASDADLWIAYTLFSAGQLWHNEYYTHIARSLLREIQQKEMVYVDGWGPILLPGDGVYWRQNQRFIINLSYYPPFLLAGLAYYDPLGPWKTLYKNLPRLYAVASPKGFAPDWLVLYEGGQWGIAPQGPFGSYNAIRCYLWVGMSAENTNNRLILQHLCGMNAILKKDEMVPEKVNTLDGKPKGNGPVGFYSAVLPYLIRLHDNLAASLASTTLYNAWHSDINIFSLHYYDNAMALFALGFVDHLYNFSEDGQIRVFWHNS